MALIYIEHKDKYKILKFTIIQKPELISFYDENISFEQTDKPIQ